MSTHDFDPASRSRLALFKKPFYTDWTVLLGAIAVGVPAWDTGQKYPAIWNGSTADFIGVSIDAGLSTLFQIVVFCFAPAAIRRRWGKFWQAVNPPAEKESRVWLVAVLVAIGSVLAGSATSAETVGEATGGDAAGLRRCTPMGVDEVCFTVVSANEDSGTLMAEWNYAEPMYEFGSWIAGWTWSVSISCSTDDGLVYGLNAVDLTGNHVALPASVENDIRSGMQRDQVPAFVAEIC